MNHRRSFVAAVPLALCLAACGGTHTGSLPDTSTPGRGALLQSPPRLVSTVVAGDLLVQLSAAINQPLLALSGTPLCDIAVYHVEYSTVGAHNESTTAAAALMVPGGLDANCHGDRPILLYAHGTSTDRAFNIADLNDARNAEGLLLAAFFAAQGYIVVAPNYTGYDTSTLSYHAYLNADQQSKDMIDALTAARLAMPAAGALITRDSGHLFITGYSQGGYVAMAAQRAMQRAGMPVTAAAPLSGPYALAAFFDAVASGQVDGGAPVFTTMLIAGYQQAYGNIYSNATDVFEAQYAPGIETLLPGLLTRGELYAQGKLPHYALFNSTPPDPLYAALTPATQPAFFAPVFALGFGTGNLLTNNYRLSYLVDATAHPDGGWPVVTTGAPASDAALAFRQALALNDLRDWVPTAPTLLCGGNGDPIVFWLNTQLIENYWSRQQPVVTNFSVLDIDSPVTTPDPYNALKADFAIAKQAVALTAVSQGATDGGATAVFEAYHATLVAPFCLAAVRDFFSSR